MQFNTYSVENISGEIEISKQDVFDNDVEQVLRELSLMVLSEFQNGDDSLFGFKSFGNDFSKIIRKNFPEIITLTENRRSMPYKFNMFLSIQPKYVIMFGDSLGQKLVDNSFPRVPDFIFFVQEVLNKHYQLKSNIFFRIIEILEFDNLEIEVLDNNRKRIICKKL